MTNFIDKMVEAGADAIRDNSYLDYETSERLAEACLRAALKQLPIPLDSQEKRPDGRYVDGTCPFLLKEVYAELQKWANEGKEG